MNTCSILKILLKSHKKSHWNSYECHRRVYSRNLNLNHTRNSGNHTRCFRKVTEEIALQIKMEYMLNIKDYRSHEKSYWKLLWKSNQYHIGLDASNYFRNYYNRNYTVTCTKVRRTRTGNHSRNSTGNHTKVSKETL